MGRRRRELAALRALHREVWGSHYDAQGGNRREHRSTRAVGIAAVVVGAAFVTGPLVQQIALATKPNPEHKITLCHATDSYTNPYVVIAVDVASVLFEGHDGHDGPVFFPAIPKHVKWGDIIPPFDFGPGLQYAGKHWTDAGRAIFDNGCNLPGPTTTTAPPTTGPPTTAPPTTGPPTTAPPTTAGPTTTAAQTTTSAPGGTTTVPGTTGTTTVPGTTGTTGTTASSTTTSATLTTLGGPTTTVPSGSISTAAPPGPLPPTGRASLPLVLVGLVLAASGFGLARRKRTV